MYTYFGTFLYFMFTYFDNSNTSGPAVDAEYEHPGSDVMFPSHHLSVGSVLLAVAVLSLLPALPLSETYSE